MELYVGLAAMSTCSCAALCSAARVGDGHVQWGKYPACVRKKEECRQAILDDMPLETAVHRASERAVIPTDGLDPRTMDAHSSSQGVIPCA